MIVCGLLRHEIILKVNAPELFANSVDVYLQ